MIRCQRIQCIAQRRCDCRDFFRFFRRQVIQVFIHGIARMNFIDDTVQTGHQLCGKGQIRVSSRVREADFNTAGFRAGHNRNTD
ncbi:Uncharacterised protein [Klebsiella pneumoniae]|nr:Uncharacterised protein [Klebsiella pneumoniae]